MKTCEWAQESEDCDTWWTACNNGFTITGGTPKENNFNYCCFCGKLLVEVPFEYENEEDEEDDEDDEDGVAAY